MILQLWKIVRTFLVKLNMAIPIQPSNSIIWHLSQRNEKLYSYTNLYTNVHSNFIDNYQKVETCQVSLNGQTNCDTSIPWNAIHQRNELLICVTTQMGLKEIMLSEKSHITKLQMWKTDKQSRAQGWVVEGGGYKVKA